MPQLDISTYASQFLWLVICFGILCVWTGWFIAPRIGFSLHSRTEKLKEQGLEAQKLLQEAENIHTESLNQLNQARHETSQYLHQAVHTLNQQRYEKISDFEHNLHIQLTEIYHRLCLQKQEILNNSQAMVSHLVESMFHKITESPIIPANLKLAIKPLTEEDIND